MALLLPKRMLLAAKIEAVEGTAETLAGADANLFAFDPAYAPTIDQFARTPTNPDLSPFASIAGKKMARITFRAELKGSGTAGTAPALGKLLKACGFGETVVASTSVTYAPITLDVPSLTIGLYSAPASGNNLKEAIRGARGTFRFSAKVGEPVMLEFDFSGVYVSPADIAGLTASGLETTKPQALLSTSLTCHGFNGHKISTLSIDKGNTVSPRTDINTPEGYFSYFIAEVNPTFSFDPEKELVATHDYYGKMNSNAEAAMSLAVGATAGNICTISAPKAQYTQVSPGVRDNLQVFNVSGKFNRNAGLDELTLAFT